MKIKKSGSEKTRQKLLETASKIFAEKGFRDTTIAEICKLAKTNIASANYHFGSKENLYKEAWRYALHLSIQKYPPDGGVKKNASYEERLRGRIKSIIYRINESDLEFSIMSHELTNPTGLLTAVIKEELFPVRQDMINIIKKLLGPDIPIHKVLFCEISIMSQCIHAMMMKKKSMIEEDDIKQLIINDIDAFVEHITKFSLAGIEAIKTEHASTKTISGK